MQAISFSPDGRTIASGDWDSIMLWDVASGKMLRTLAQRKFAVRGQRKGIPYFYDANSVFFSPDGRTIGAAGKTQEDDHPPTIELWDVASGKTLRTLQGHTDSVISAAYSPDGRKIASGSWDQTIKLWDAASGEGLRTLRGHTGFVYSVAFSPDGRQIASGGDDLTIKFWDAATGEELRTLQGHTSRVRSIAFSPDGRMIASGSADKTIKLWRVGDEAPLTDAGPAGGPAAPAQAGLPSFPTPVTAAPTVPSTMTAIVSAPGPLASAPTSPPPGRRVALIVANGDYRAAPLVNPTIDAGLVAKSLKEAGFDVTVKTNIDLDAFELALTQFADTAKGADLALFYFAGHGFSVASGGIQQNLLMATSANFEAKTTLALMGGGEPLDHVEEMLIGHARATLIFIDACRNIPALASRGVGGRGFARIDTDALDGAYVVLSTRQGQTAADGDNGRGSPFARAFAAALPVPGLRIEDAFARMREAVRKETGGLQIPDVIRSDLPEGGVMLRSTRAP